MNSIEEISQKTTSKFLSFRKDQGRTEEEIVSELMHSYSHVFDENVSREDMKKAMKQARKDSK